MINIFKKIVLMTDKELQDIYNLHIEKDIESLKSLHQLKIENFYLKEFIKDLAAQIRVPSSYCVVCDKSNKCKSFAETSCLKRLENEERLKNLGVN